MNKAALALILITPAFLAAGKPTGDAIWEPTSAVRPISHGEPSSDDSRGEPPAERSVIVRQVNQQTPTERIQWLTDADAKASGKPILLAVRMDNCGPCDRADAMLRDPRLVAWSKHFACVYTKTAPSWLTTNLRPCDVFVTSDGRSFAKHAGCPERVEAYMQRFWKGKWFADSYEPPVTQQASYPVRGRQWMWPGNLLTHMTHYDAAQRATGANHTKFDPAFLASLTHAELQSLHGDDHDSNVDHNRVSYRPNKQRVQTARPVSTCLTGACPSVRRQVSFQRRGLFSRFR